VWLTGYLEGDTVPCSATVAGFFLHEKHIMKFSTQAEFMHYRDALRLHRNELQRLLDAIARRWLRIRHPALYAAFMLDPLFIELRKDAVTTVGGENMQVESVKAIQWIVDFFSNHQTV
jgi:hypothetical protein